MRKKMRELTQYGLVAAIVLVLLALAALATPSVTAVQETAEFAVVIDTGNTNWRAIRVDTGTPPSSEDQRVVNPVDGLVELRAMDMQGNYIELWTLQEDTTSGSADWTVAQINGNRFYHWATEKIRAWVMNDRAQACSELMRVTGGSKQCEITEPAVSLWLPLVNRGGLPPQPRPADMR